MNAVIEDGKIMDKAGVFAIEQPEFEPYTAEIIGERESIMGLPKELTARLLKQAGV